MEITYSKILMEDKKELVCEKCGKEFDKYDMESIGQHAHENQHYSFKLKGTNLTLAVL